ncbi:MAG: hypothetical protein AAFO69_17680, partial [Bacteroidota bacterium]
FSRLLVSFDTVQVGLSSGREGRRWSFGGFSGAQQRQRVGGRVEARYSGVEVGASIHRRHRNLSFQLDFSYQYLIDQVSGSSVEEVTETRIDTISTFFVIRDGVREPVYITEATEISSEVRTNTERTNTLQFIGLSLTGGYQLPVGDVSIGMRLGIRADWLISRDEWLFLENQRVTSQNIGYAAPATSLVAHFPVSLHKEGLIGTLSFTPFFQYGLNNDILTPNLGGKRQVLGIRLGFLF